MAEGVDFVLSDMSMLGMDGFELLPKIRAIDPDVAVVMVTGNHETENAVAAMRSGADDYLLKPFASQELFRQEPKKITSFVPQSSKKEKQP